MVMSPDLTDREKAKFRQTPSGGTAVAVIGDDGGGVPITSPAYTFRAAEALPSLSSSAALFPSVAAGDKFIRLTLRGSPITVRLDAGTATASANGIDMALGSYELTMSGVLAAAARAIQTGPTATGYIEYFN